MVDKKFVGLKEVFPLSHIAYKPLGLKWTRAMRECMCEATAYMSFFRLNNKQSTGSCNYAAAPLVAGATIKGVWKGGKVSVFSSGPRKSL